MRHDHAVVLGGGVAGLFAARVLSETFARVTVIERDALPEHPDERRGVPQGRHIHGFQARGVEIVAELFPALLEEMIAAGASRICDLSELHFRVGGHLLTQHPEPIAPVLLASRPYLEYGIRRRVAARHRVTLRDHLEVAALTHTRPGRGNAVVTGVRVVPPGGGRVEEIGADLVVDATGRGSRTPAWLAELGYERPPEERIAVRVKYASQLLRLPARGQPRRFVIDGRSPGRNIGVALFACENDSWVFTVLGAERAFPTTATREWMVDVAEGKLPDQALAAVRAAEPLSPVSMHQHPASIRRRYDRLDRFPDGLLVMGDALCAFNPIYGQGMSVAAVQALALRACLAEGDDRLARRFLRACAPAMNNAWQLAAGSDLAYPDVEGNPTRAMRLMGRYVQRVLRAAETDPHVARRFLAVSGLVASPAALFSPRVLGPALARGAGRPGPHRPDAVPVREPVG
jgi:2-polyprenyl-6-methoxyphenol hydroxylase-like FAD-dependent oxidoreductase